LWLRLPVAHEVLSREPLSSFMEPVPALGLNPDTAFEDAMLHFTDKGLDFGCILDDQRCLWGVLTRRHFLRAIEALAAIPMPQRSCLCLKEVVPPDPVWVTMSDSSLTAAATMLEHELPGIAVVQSAADLRVVGYIPAEKLTRRILQHLGRRGAEASAS
jgi:CBS-domain-containing membrane protein